MLLWKNVSLVLYFQRIRDAFCRVTDLFDSSDSMTSYGFLDFLGEDTALKVFQPNPYSQAS